jgi:putative RecB family exonuclease
MLKLSASSMGTYEKCPKSYHYRYIDKPKIEKKEWPHLEFGTCAHRVLELFHMDLCENVRTVEEWPIVMRDSFKKALKESNIELLQQDMPLLRTILQDYLNNLRETGLTEVVATELPFNFKIGEFTIRGVIDRIDKVGPGEYHVVDYKTSKSSKYLKDFQLILYAIAIKILYPDAVKISGSYCMLKHKSVLKSWDFSDEDLDRVRAKILDIGTSITIDEKWETKESFLCNWCDYKTICLDSWVD